MSKPHRTLLFPVKTKLTHLSQWNTAFGTPNPLGHAIPTTPGFPPTTSSSQDLTALHDTTTTTQHLQTTQQQPPTSVPPLSTYTAGGAPSAPLAPGSTTFVSPSMWQSSVAAVYEGGQQGLLRNSGLPTTTTAGGGGGTPTSGWELGSSGMISQIINRQPR